MQHLIRKLLPGILILFMVHVLDAQNIRINEMVSSNSIYNDGDGDQPDWFELHNYGATPVSLQNWSVSDNEEELDKWVFPNITLAPNEYFQVWASSKDRAYLTFPRTVVNHGDIVKYIIPSSEPSANWKTINYNDNSWEEGPTGIGFGDEDDATVVPGGTNSVYIRASFTMSNLNDLLYLIFDVDYDDGFVAYINGMEVARSNVDEEAPLFDDRASREREAIMFTGGKPERYYLVTEEDYIVEGENLLCIQLFNHDPSSSDLTMIPFLTGVFVVQTGLGVTPPEILDLPDRKFHTNFKISAQGEPLILSNAQHQIVDQIPALEIPSDYSVGRFGSESDIYYLPNTTPGEENEGPVYSGLLNSEIVFSHSGGFLSEPINLSMQGNTENQLIRYTTDATIPTEESNLYSVPLSIDSNTVIRASIFKPNYIPSQAQNRTFVFDQNTELDAIFLTTDPYNLFDDEYGIYVFGPEGTYDPHLPYYGANFWEDWERPIHIAFYEKETGDLGAEFNGGVKIYGNWSRAQYDQRSLALYARSSYGDSKFEYPFFEHLTYDKFENLVLRNSGQDFLASCIKDIALSSLMENSGLEYQDYRPVSTFINGEYWGMYHLREKVNEHLLASKFNIDSDEITLLTANAEAIEGSNQEYRILLDYVSTTDLSNDENFDFVREQVDIKNYALYQATEIFFGNFDWPGSNIKYWKQTEGKWRWILYDLDQAFGRLATTANYDINSLDSALEENGPEWPNPPWATLFFRNLMENVSFRNDFINRYADELNTRFLPEQVKAHFDTISESIQSELDAHFARWEGDPSEQQFYVNEMKNWADHRPAIAKQQIMVQFQIPAFHNLNILNEDLSAGYVKVNDNLKILDENWNGDYFETVPIQLKAVAELGYMFSHWTGASSSTEPLISLSLENNISITPHFVPAVNNDLLVINEINYNSADELNPDDWIELYNPNEAFIDISAWMIKDENDDNVYSFPSGTLIEAKSYLVITKDGSAFRAAYPDITYFVGDLGFGLGGGGDAVRLFNDDDILQDIVVYQDSLPWPNCADGFGPTLELKSPELDNSLPENWKCINTFGSPGLENTNSSGTDDTFLLSIRTYPNPVNNRLYITGLVEATEVNIYNISGQLVLSEHVKSNMDVSSLESGIYILSIIKGKEQSIHKLVKR